MEPSHTPGRATPRPSLVSPSGGPGAPGYVPARILDNLAGGAGVRVPAQKKSTRRSPIWFGLGLVTAFALVMYGVLSHTTDEPAAVRVAAQPAVVVPPVLLSAPPLAERAESQAATITNEPQEPAPGDTTTAAAAAGSHNVLTNALEKDVKPPPLALSKALESAQPSAAPAAMGAINPNTKTAARAKEKPAKEVNETKSTKASPAKPDHDVEILQILVAHNAKRRAASNPAPAGDVKSRPPQSRASAPPASSEPAPPENPE